MRCKVIWQRRQTRSVDSHSSRGLNHKTDTKTKTNPKKKKSFLRPLLERRLFMMGMFFVFSSRKQMKASQTCARNALGITLQLLYDSPSGKRFGVCPWELLSLCPEEHLWCQRLRLLNFERGPGACLPRSQSPMASDENGRKSSTEGLKAQKCPSISESSPTVVRLIICFWHF